MKRFHVHVTVDDVSANVAFYSRLFGQPPTKLRSNYAKWMLEDPRVNFAISSQSARPGLNHLGLQAETADELAELRERALAAADGTLRDEGSVACCYARSDKHWTVDPQGIAWEHFMTRGDAPELGMQSASCCVPVRDEAGSSAASCCVPADEGRACCA